MSTTLLSAKLLRAETSDFSRLRLPETTVAMVERQFKEMIRSGVLVTGMALPPERQLAERLSISRPPLREALQSLTSQGVLQVKKGSGWVVAPNQNTVVDNLEIYFLLKDVTLENVIEARSVIEPELAALAAVRRTPEQLKDIGQAWQATRNARGSEEFFKADSDFHAHIAEASGNALLIMALRPLFGLLIDVRLSLSAAEEVVNDSHPEHAEIFEAIRDGDAIRARSAAVKHASCFLTRAQLAVSRDAVLANEVGSAVTSRWVVS